MKIQIKISKKKLFIYLYFSYLFYTVFQNNNNHSKYSEKIHYFLKL